MTSVPTPPRPRGPVRPPATVRPAVLEPDLGPPPPQPLRRRAGQGLFTARIWVSLALTFGSLFFGCYCVYRAVTPLASLYEGALNDPMGDRDRTSEGPNPKLIGAESFRWAAMGVPALLAASVLGLFVRVSWKRRRLQLRGEVAREPGLRATGAGRYEYRPPGSSVTPSAADPPPARPAAPPAKPAPGGPANAPPPGYG